MSIDTQTTQQLRKFFTAIFGDNKGIVCIANRSLEAIDKGLDEAFFAWPRQVEMLVMHVETLRASNNVWYCPHILKAPRRIKANVVTCPTIWADLDYCAPEQLLVVPSIVIQSSEARYQALWRLSETLTPQEAEHISKRIAYYHAEAAKDKSGWDLTQLLRVPYTYNYKYGGIGIAPIIKVESVVSTTYNTDSFAAYPDVEHTNIADSIGELPTEIPTPKDVLMKYRSVMSPMIPILYSDTPTEHKWSEDLWNLQLLLFEAGCSPVEVYSVCTTARCNKFARDGRGTTELWLDIGRAYSKYEVENSSKFGYSQKLDNINLLTPEQRRYVEQTPGLVEQYITWAKSTVDSPPQYHIAGGFVALSALLAGDIRLPTSFGIIKPNLWFMILADTTLTRKSTSMERAMDFIEEVDSDIILATDGTLEGILNEMSTRPSRPSIFYRDEFSGLLDSMHKKDFLAGLAETFTKLYDGRMQKKVLSKRTVIIQQPCFMLFVGGIKSRIFDLLSSDDVISGFLPRFVFITANMDVTKVRPMGPPTPESLAEKEQLLNKFKRLYNHYNGARSNITVNGITTQVKKTWDAQLTPDAWDCYNNFEAQMILQATNHAKRETMLPSMDRLAKSGLKAAILIAATRKLDKEVIVEEQDIIHAFYYVEKWRDYLMEVLMNIGKSAYEGLLDKIINAIKRAGPDGLKKGHIMRTYQLNSRNMEEILDTLNNRHHIIRRGPKTPNEVVISILDPEDKDV